MLQRIVDGRTDLVFDYLAGGHGDATSRDRQGTPLIRWCAWHGDVSAVRHLLAHGETLETLGPNLGLDGAAFHGHWQLCQYLLEQGADANFAAAGTGETPLHAALCKANRPHYEHVVAVLLASGANPGARTVAGVETGQFMRDCRTRGETPLHRAAAFASPATLRMLIDAGADRAARDAHGETPLAWASWHLRPAEVLRLLCYDDYGIHPDNQSDYDHGRGWHSLDPHGRTRPHLT